MTSKKILTAFDPKKPTAKSSDFLCPVMEQGTPVFYGLKSKRVFTHGVVVFVGRTLTANDVFAKLVDSGRKIESVSQCLKDIESYLAALSERRLGDVFGIARQDAGLVLVATDLRPDVERVPLP